MPSKATLASGPSSLLRVHSQARTGLAAGITGLMHRHGTLILVAARTNGWFDLALATRFATASKHGQVLGGQITMRTRLEQRSINIGDDLGVVLRFATKYVRPISADGDTSLIVGLEPFVDLQDTDWGGDAGIGQNRTYLGLGRRISNKLTLEVGYMHQYIFRDTGEDRLNHLAMLTIKAKL